MRCVTTGATIGLYRHVFIDEGPLFIHMAFEANLVSVGESPDLPKGGRAMSIVAIAALDQTFIDAMVVRPTEVGDCGLMTAVAKSGLRLNQQMFRFRGVMRRVAVETTDVVAGVRRTREVPLLVIFTVASQATSACLLAR